MEILGDGEPIVVDLTIADNPPKFCIAFVSPKDIRKIEKQSPVLIIFLYANFLYFFKNNVIRAFIWNPNPNPNSNLSIDFRTAMHDESSLFIFFLL